MIPKDQEKIISLYESRLDQYADSAKTVGWGSREDQFLRFATLCRGLELKGKRVLDIGCGLGDFVSFADQHTGGDYDYVGVDIAEKLISRAKNKFPSDRRTFL
ncbi:MAG: methyltransferase domain-containing protein, partial [Nisaea sp.]